MASVYFIVSVVVMIFVFMILRKISKSQRYQNPVNEVLITIVPAIFHFYVLNYEKIPLLDIDVSNNDTVIYLSLAFGYLSAVPYLIAKKLHE